MRQVSARRASAKHSAAEGADPGPFGGREDAAVDAAHDDDEEHGDRPDVLERHEPLPQVERSPRGPEAGSVHTIHCTARHSSKVASMPGRMPAANSLPMLVSVITP